MGGCMDLVRVAAIAIMKDRLQCRRRQPYVRPNSWPPSDAAPPYPIKKQDVVLKAGEPLRQFLLQLQFKHEMGLEGLSTTTLRL